MEVTFLNICEPNSGLYVVPFSYYEFFKIKGIKVRWVNLAWDKNVNFNGDVIKFHHFFGSGYSVNSIINVIVQRYDGINGIKIYTDPRLMPKNDGKELMIIHDFFRPANGLDAWKHKRVLKALKREKTRVITNSKLTAEMAREKGLNVVSELYTHYGYEYNSNVAKEKLVLSIGTNISRKRPDLILNFLNGLEEEWSFIRIGGDLREIGEIRTKANYIYKERVTLEELNSIYEKSMYLFLPSESEGLGLPMIEALHHNVAVVANIKNKVLKEFSFPNVISVQNDDDFHLPPPPRAEEFALFRNWYRNNIERQFKIILETIEGI